MLKGFEAWLREKEKSKRTVGKYIKDVSDFVRFTEAEITRERILEYKEHLCGKYKAASVNSKIAAVNNYLSFIGQDKLKMRSVRVQRNVFSANERFLTKNEYKRLLDAARKKERLYLLIQTICSTGIRISELQFVNIEAAKAGFASVSMKGKTRVIFIPKKLCRLLLNYAKKRGVEEGCIFTTRSGRAVDRSNVWREMKSLCEAAGVEKSKVFPHNLRHLFAREFYKAEKDIVHLADILGHSSVETTRIYTMETCEEQRRKIERLGLLLI